MSLAVAPSHPFMATDGLGDNLFPAATEYSVSQAAKFLGVSEGYIREILEDDLVMSRLENGERLIEYASLLAYGQERRRMNAALDEMCRMNQEMGLYDD